MEFRDHVRLLRRTWPLLVVATLLGALLGGGYGQLQAPKYTASARAFVSVNSSATLADLTTGVTAAQQAANGYAAVATTAYVLQPVIARLGLATTSTALAARVQVTVPPTSQVLHVTVTDATPERAAAIANELVRQLTSAPIGSTADRGAVRLTAIDPAVVDRTPVGPGPAVPLAVGALLGLLLAVGGALLRDALDSRVRSRQDLDRVSDLPVLASVVHDPKAGRLPLAFADPVASPAAAECYRTLRTNLRFLELDEAMPSFAITSAVQGEGKSVIAANVALAMAGLGRRVLLVDADLRRPRVARIFAVEGTVGLSDVLVGSVELRDAVQSFGDSGLDLLPAGTVPPNPNEQLQSKAMRRLVDRLHAEYDLVLFDTPPVLPVSDAVVMSAQVGAVVVVAASGRVRRPQLADALGRLNRAGARTAGIVLNMVPRSEPEGRVKAYEFTPAETPERPSRRDGRRPAGGEQLHPRPSATTTVSDSADGRPLLAAPFEETSGTELPAPLRAIGPGEGSARIPLREFARPVLFHLPSDEQAAAAEAAEPAEPAGPAEPAAPNRRRLSWRPVLLRAIRVSEVESTDRASAEVSEPADSVAPVAEALVTVPAATVVANERATDPRAEAAEEPSEDEAPASQDATSRRALGRRLANPVRLPPPPGLVARIQQQSVEPGW